MKKSTLVVGMMLLYFGLSAQQDPQFTQWMFDKVSFNPAATGASDWNCLSLFYRDQWDGLEEDPKTSMINLHGQVAPNVGLGFVFADDRLGQLKNTTIRFNGAYHYQLPSSSAVLSGGLSLTSNGMQMGKEWRPWQPGDPDVPTEASSSSSFDVGFGAMIRDNNYYAGISSTHLNESELDLDVAKYNVIRHYYIMGGYDYPINTDFTLRSNALIKTDANSTVFDINVNALWKDMFWGGLSFRPGDAIAPMAGFQYQLNDVKSNPNFVWSHKILFGYSYDATLSELNNHSTGSHEIFLTYCFSIQEIIIKRIYSNPRFL